MLMAAALLSTLQLVSAQEKLPREEALVYAKIVSPFTKQAGGIATDVDIQKPVVVKDEDYAGMALPQKNLNAESIAQASETPVPIGQLWLHKLTPMRDGSGLPADKLRLVSVRHEGEEITVPACALGAQRNRSGALELLVFGKDKEPILKLPLKKIETTQELPIDITAERTGEGAAVTLKILGKYEAKLKVTELEI
jgi:hypothetical protein